MFRTKSCRVIRPLASRGLHSLPRLPYDYAQGIPGLFSAQAFKTAWTDYQGVILEKLNNASLESDNEARTPFHILLNTAQKRDQAHLFNYASQAYNNHLFFLSLKPQTQTDDNTVLAPHLERRVVEAFGSVEGLRKAISEAASNLTGNGWVFLVEEPSKKLALIASHNAGTPFNFGREQTLDLNAPASEAELAQLAETEDAVARGLKNHNIALLALNLWQHAYVPDFGVAGQQQYIDAWWKTISWDAVAGRLYKPGRT